ncbi:hypothetical protein MKW98_001637 [Papaver atlanticum]|uniref:Copine C-terminal domain-containing protein n=1 Tax=Papaver atlanticum TaxID=357466 RepID=A0AAD4SAL3_9MAGN|nr:hypothetical protein MKW98_001637 [Papaver atlanticum]
MNHKSKSVKFCITGLLRMWEKSYGRLRSNHISIICQDSAFEKNKEALEQADLILGVDFTKSNEETGQVSFKGKSLHLIREGIPNPYQQAMTVLGEVFPFWDTNKPISCYGFGEATTLGGVLSFRSPCNGIADALAQYKEMVPNLYLAGPKSFAPVINMAISTVKKNQGKHYVLLIISNGPYWIPLVHRNKDTECGQLSCQEQETIEAIELARKFSLSIILIGVGDKSKDMSRFFEDHLSAEALEIFQVVNHTEIMAQNLPKSEKEMDFSLAIMKKLRCV